MSRSLFWHAFSHCCGWTMVNHPILQIASAPVARDVEVDEEDSDGITPLMISCQMGNQQSCRRNSWICHDLPVPGVALLQDCFGPGYLLTLVSLYGMDIYLTSINPVSITCINTDSHGLSTSGHFLAPRSPSVGHCWHQFLYDNISTIRKLL